MTVGIFEQPDFEAHTGTEYKTAIDNSIMVLARLAGGFAPHEQDTPDMTVRVDAGPVFLASVLTEIDPQNSPTITAPVTHPRIDRVVRDVDGAVSVITGEEGAVPVAPAFTTGYLPICRVSLAISTTAITNDLIDDERITATGAGEGVLVNGISQNLGAFPAGELGYGTWVPYMGDGQFVPKYPPAYSDDYVKVTGIYNVNYYAWFAIDPEKSLIGPPASNSWLDDSIGEIRFHIKLARPMVINGLSIDNYHHTGADLTIGVQNFTFWGSNDADAFAELTYAVDTNWTQIITHPTALAQHAAADEADPQFIAAANTTAYRYYALKFVDNWGYGTQIGIRRIELCVRPHLWLRTA